MSAAAAMKTPEQIARSAFPLADPVTLPKLIAMIEEARALPAAPVEPRRAPIARDSEYEVTSYADTSGKWVCVEVFDADAEQALWEQDQSAEQITAASLVLSDVEAVTLLRELAEALTAVSPVLARQEGWAA